MLRVLRVLVADCDRAQHVPFAILMFQCGGKGRTITTLNFESSLQGDDSEGRLGPLLGFYYFRISYCHYGHKPNSSTCARGQGARVVRAVLVLVQRSFILIARSKDVSRAFLLILFSSFSHLESGMGCMGCATTITCFLFFVFVFHTINSTLCRV